MNEADFNKNFAPIKPLMTETQAAIESSRCLFCFDPPCMKSCPTEIDIPLFIRQIHTGNMTGAAKTIYNSNVFGNTCGKVCPTEVLCEGSCVYNNTDVKVIEIGRLQTYATTKAIHEKKKIVTLPVLNGKKVAVIGSGPAGIACASELRMLGYSADIFEAKSKPSGLTVHGIAPYKITNEEVMDEMDYLKEQFELNIIYDSPVKEKADIEKLESNYSAIFLGVGLGKTGEIGIAGEQLKNCSGAVEMIEVLRMKKHETVLGKKVIVLGGGNTAMDAGSEAARMGAESVILAYRRSKHEMGAYEFEFDLAKAVGVQGWFNVAPLAILGNEVVEGVKFIRTETRDGKVVNIEGSEFTEACDMVIKATGQSKQTSVFDLIDGLDLDSGKRIHVDPISFQTSNSKYFAAGDAVSGGEEVVNAVACGKKAARGIHAFISK